MFKSHAEDSQTCGSESAIFLLSLFRPLCQTTISQTVQVLTVILPRNWCLSQREALQPLSVFIGTNLSWSIKLGCPVAVCCVGRPFSNVVRMCTSSLVPKPKITVVGLGARLVHTWNRELSTAGTVSSRSSCQGLCRIGRALHLALLTYNYAKKQSTPALVMLGWSCSCLSMVVSLCERKSGNQLHKGRYHVRIVAGSSCRSSGSSWQIMLHVYLYTCLEPLLNCQCCSSFEVVVTVHLRKHS